MFLSVNARCVICHIFALVAISNAVDASNNSINKRASAVDGYVSSAFPRAFVHLPVYTSRQGICAAVQLKWM